MNALEVFGLCLLVAKGIWLLFSACPFQIRCQVVSYEEFQARRAGR